MGQPKRYTTLEGIRGIGAIYVVLVHGILLFGAAAPRSAYLGVDFFFALSGFIMAHVYSDRLRLGMLPVAFVYARFLRFYPLYLLGTVAGVAVAAGSWLVGDSHLLWDYTKPLVSLPFELCLLPSPVSDAMFPLDIPAWSLMLEFVVNIGFAVRWLRTTPALLAVMALAAMGLAGALMTVGNLNSGWDKAGALWGLSRICFSFTLGVLVYPLQHRIRVPAGFGIVPLLVFSVLVFANPAGPARIAFDVVFVTVVSPALLLFGAASTLPSRRLERACIYLGGISYPLYTLHYPILMEATGAIQRHVPAGPATAIAATAVLIALVLLASYAAKLDVWTRARLGARWRLGGNLGSAVRG